MSHPEILPASCLQEVPEEFLVARKGRWGTGSCEPLGLDQPLLQALQAAEAVRSEDAQEVGVRGVPRGTCHQLGLAHLGEGQTAAGKCRCIRKPAWLMHKHEGECSQYLNQLLLEEPSKMRMIPCHRHLADHLPEIRKTRSINNGKH